MTRKFFQLLTLTSLITMFSLTAQAQAPKYSNDFLSIGTGSRAFAMGQATVALCDDVSSAYYNPAGLLGIKTDLQFGIMHSEYFAGIAKYDWGAVGIPLKAENQMMGISIFRFAVDDIPNTLFLIEPDGSINYDNITSFSAQDYAFLFSYARGLNKEGLSIGTNAKVIHRTAGDFATAWGFGLDAGLQYQKTSWRFGLMLRDITSTFNAWSFSFTEEEQVILAQEGNEIPVSSLEITTPKVILGLAYDWNIKDKISIRPEFDFDITTDGMRNVLITSSPFSVDPHLGLEIGYSKIIYIRAGVNNIQRHLTAIPPSDSTGMVTYERTFTVQPNIGVGLQLRNLQLAYAFTNLGNVSDALYSHVFSVVIGFNKKQKPSAE